MPDVGEKAPDFNLLDQNNERFILSKALTKGKVLLVFYPGDDTPVCTAQLCDYRDHHSQFQTLGVQVFGITIAHTYELHQKFAHKHNIPFPLLNDYDSRVTKEYKVMSIMGVPKRALLLIGEDGTIVYRHVEFLPILRRSSQDLVKDLAKVLKVEAPPPPAKKTVEEHSHVGHH